MRISAIAARILRQLRHDKRTLALMLAAPLLLLTLIFFILDSSSDDFQVAVINAPQSYVDRLYENNVITTRCTENEAAAMLEDGSVIASISIISDKAYICIDGHNSQKASAVLGILEASKLALPSINRPDLKSDITYTYGYGDLSAFDNFGSTLIGVLVFFFVFLVAGISFLSERTSGTLEKLLSTPVRRYEIVCGYMLGFGLVTLLQAGLITFYVIYVLGVMMAGSVWLVFLIMLLSATTALSLGILLSTVASSEFQMIQFIPIVIVPQVFFSGLFELSPTFELVGKFMPLSYVADALTEVMIKGNGFSSIKADIYILLGCTAVFMVFNTLLLKRHRKI